MPDQTNPALHQPSSARNPAFHGKGFLLLVVVSFICGFGLHWGMVAGRFAQSTSADSKSSEGAIRCAPGPWGTLECTPITLAAPEEFLQVRSMEALPVHWVLSSTTTEQFEKFVNSLELTAEQQSKLLSPEARKVTSDGLTITVPDEIFLALKPEVRSKVYQVLARNSKNDLLYLPKELAAERFNKGSVLPKTQSLFRQVSVDYGNYRVFFGISCVLRNISDYDEKVRFMKVLTMETSYVVRLHLTAESNIHELTSYWGRAFWLSDVKSFLESFSNTKGGAWLDVIELLPPLPSALLYTYPMPENPMKGPIFPRDCYWTAMNFFRDTPDNTLVGDRLKECLKNDYYPANSDPRYGDVIILTTPDGQIVHFAVFIADNLVFTKNGETPIHPWIFSTLKEVVEHYSHAVPPGQKLTVNYYRNKYY